MSSVITLDFEKWKAQQTAAGNPVVLDEFVFAYVPDLDPSQGINRDEKLPADNHIVHRQAVNKTGLASENAVAYSVTLGTEVGHFDFNWIGLINKTSGVIGMITHAPTQKKIKTANGLQGNVLTRSFLLEFAGAAKETAITTTAETWQIDFTARLSGIDEMQRLMNTDSYGEAAFFDEGFAVVRHGEQYLVKKGLAYVGGLRGILEFDQTLNSQRNTRVYADFSYQGNLVSQWKTVVQITVANELQNYIDAAGYPHYVFAVASIDGNGNITDLRITGSLNDRDIAELNRELSRVKRVYATEQELENGLEEKQPRGDYATNTDLNIVRENASGRLAKSKNGEDIPNKNEFVKNLGLARTVELAINAASLTERAPQAFNSDIYARTVISGLPGYDRTYLEVVNGTTLWQTYVEGRNYALRHPIKTGTVATLEELYQKSELYTKRDLYTKTELYTKDALYTKAESNNRFGYKNTSDAVQNGWWKCGDTGLMFQWGYTDNILAESSETIKFPLEFSYRCFGGIATPSYTHASSSNSSAYFFNLNDGKHAVITCDQAVGTPDDGTYIFWWAVGI
ncbi:phage tail protein [Xenorhabdus bovienii]|uniref:Tail fiber protein n=1 Tax=Xenorhabdus bovienii str. feltiae Moldova TaxID=1398200 RepID=A0A077NWN9_XENBV|nr:phage tail protein [Xenorhabdus bovienii]CDH02853.1 hypothetical protein XBFM1_480033 [Xenorhabdus bovienii str. feltiae Moldova]